MTPFSRREFLQLCGITFAAGALFDADVLLNNASSRRSYARTFGVTSVYATPNGKVVQKLFPDSVLTLQSEQDGWFRVDGGYLPRRAVQPMPKWRTQIALPDALPALIEVSASIAPIYAQCDSTTPALTRIGHGGVMQAIDYLPDARSGWFAVAHDDGSPIGWSRAERWNAVQPVAAIAHIDSIIVHSSTQQLVASSRDRHVATFDIAAFPALERGDYALRARQQSLQNGRYHGVSWVTQWTNGLQLNGAYWHNDFGQANENRQIELSPYAAQWLHQHLDDHALLRVV